MNTKSVIRIPTALALEPAATRARFATVLLTAADRARERRELAALQSAASKSVSASGKVRWAR